MSRTRVTYTEIPLVSARHGAKGQHLRIQNQQTRTKPPADHGLRQRPVWIRLIRVDCGGGAGWKKRLTLVDSNRRYPQVESPYIQAG